MTIWLALESRDEPETINPPLLENQPRTGNAIPVQIRRTTRGPVETRMAICIGLLIHRSSVPTISYLLDL